MIRTVVTTQFLPQQIINGGQYPPYQPLQNNPEYGAQLVPTGPYQDQPCVPGLPPPYHEAGEIFRQTWKIDAGNCWSWVKFTFSFVPSSSRISCSSASIHQRSASRTSTSSVGCCSKSGPYWLHPTTSLQSCRIDKDRLLNHNRMLPTLV